MFRRRYVYTVHIVFSFISPKVHPAEPYIGMTNNLDKHTWQRKTHTFKQLKNRRREKKIRLIAAFNSSWKDFAADRYKTQDPSPPLGMRCRF